MSTIILLERVRLRHVVSRRRVSGLASDSTSFVDRLSLPSTLLLTSMALDTIHMMTQKTTKLLPDTSTIRPCVVKTTHSMGSKGIFIIQNDEDEAEFAQFLEDSGHPTFVVSTL